MSARRWLLCACATVTATAGAGRTAATQSFPDPAAQVVLEQRVSAIRNQCLRSAQDSALAAIRAREDAMQLEWCDRTRAARRSEFTAAFLDSVRHAKDGGGGLARTLADFLSEHPESVKPDGAKGALCADEKLRIDDELVAPVVNEPSVARRIFGVTLNGTRVSRLNPVAPWNRLVQEHVVLRSGQMTYKTPLPEVPPREQTAAVQTAQDARCPSAAVLDDVLSTRSTDPAPVSAAANAPVEADAFAKQMLGAPSLRQQLNPMMQLGQLSRQRPAMSEACQQEIGSLLTYDELGRRLGREVAGLVSPVALEKVSAVAAPFGGVEWFLPDGQMRSFHPQNEQERQRVAEVYGDGGVAAFMVDVAAVGVAANQGLTLALDDWSLARSALIARCIVRRP